MKLLVNIDQKGSIRAGYDAPHSTQITEIQIADLPEDLRPWFADNYNLKSGEVKCEARRTPYGWSSAWGDWSGELTLSHPITTERIVSALRELREQHMVHIQDVQNKAAADSAADLNLVREILTAGPVTKSNCETCGDSEVRYTYQTYENLPTGLQGEARGLADAAWSKIHHPYDTARAAAKKEADKIESARLDRENTEIRNLIPTEHRERFDANLMSRSEIQSHIRVSITLPPGQSDYKPLTDDDLEHEDHCEQLGCESEYDCDPAPDATPEQYSQLQEVRKTHPDAQLMQHSGKFTCNDGWIFRFSIRVTGLRRVTRHFACAEIAAA